MCDTDHLDLSWTEEHIRTTNSQTIYCKEQMYHINIKFIYVNTNSNVCKVVQEKHPLKPLNNSGSVLSEYIVMQLAKTKNIIDDVRYKLDDILVYFVPLDPVNVFDYAKNDDTISSISNHSSSHSSVSTGYSASSNDFHFMKIIPILGDIIIPTSLFVFHPLNTIYFIFREMVLIQDIVSNIPHSPPPPPPPKSKTPYNPSCMKKTGADKINKTVKRVRILTPSASAIPTINLPSSGSDHGSLHMNTNKTAKLRIL